jgi:thioredoxin reductase
MAINARYDVVIVGGGPAGLAAALTLGRARKRVLLCDSGPPRNAAATEVHNFVTRDGTPPSEFRRIARQQLEPYANVEVRDARVSMISGEHGSFDVHLESGAVDARRVILCTGMIDELPDIDGIDASWGKSTFICPYCHGWEVQDQRWAYLAADSASLSFALLLRSWTRDVVALTDAKVAVDPEMREKLDGAGISIEERPITRLIQHQGNLERIEFADGEFLRRDVLVVRPRQHQVDLVVRLGLALDARGYVTVDEMERETSTPGIYAAGDLVSPAQAAVLAAASGMQAAASINRTLTTELAMNGSLQQ